MTSKFSDLDQPITIQFDRIFIDPNNPRIAEERDTRYDQPDEIFDPDLQKALTERTYDVYNAKKLEDTIVAQGWIPIDPIIVWEHPGRRGHYVVVEGNTRTSVLRTIRESTLPREQAKLERFEKRRKAPAEEVQRQKRHVARLKSIIDGTDILTVYPVNASTTEELEKRLPRVMGVRHISHAQQWGPYAQNLYILSLYRRLFAERYGADMPLRLEQDLIERVASMVSLGETKTRRNIQAGPLRVRTLQAPLRRSASQRRTVFGSRPLFLREHPATQIRSGTVRLHQGSPSFVR